ncbi:hypothetical protein F2Q69_00003357 [Brassica cretica]|uniref:Uncharacterized protein n=1 Tax=Brassica cretica TaxID=69181 RepID=A0A8S9P7N1_BRACR|nr:hypothetical protein F2Q69_00003357 [Brassica cretica]
MVLRQAQNSIGYLSPLIELRQISFRSWRAEGASPQTGYPVTQPEQARKMAKKAEQLMKTWKCHNHKVEQALLKDEAFQKLVNFFQSCLEDHHFVHMLEPFLKIITESSRINKTLDRLRCL